MRSYFTPSHLSEEEKNDILSKHREVYNGYQTLNPAPTNQQPLYVQDFAKDKVGAVMGHKGNIKGYTNMGINESFEEEAFDDDVVTEDGECMECGWRGNMEEEREDLPDSNLFESGECMECGGMVREGECMECGWKGKMDEGTGHLDDIYDVKDLNPKAGFDYIEGPSNDVDTFQDMHKDLYESSYTGGGNAPDMDITTIEPGYDFESDGPEKGDGPFKIKAKDMDLDDSEEWDAYDFVSGGSDNGGEAYPVFEEMHSAFSDLDEVDISGSQGMYGDMEPAYDFDSEGPGDAGPYQRSNYSEIETKEYYFPLHKMKKMQRQKDAEDSGEEFDDSELDMSDYDDYGDMKDKSWQEISSITGDDEFGGVDEEIKESFIIQKNKINEMFFRMQNFK